MNIGTDTHSSFANRLPLNRLSVDDDKGPPSLRFSDQEKPPKITGLVIDIPDDVPINVTTAQNTIRTFMPDLEYIRFPATKRVAQILTGLFPDPNTYLARLEMLYGNDDVDWKDVLKNIVNIEWLDIVVTKHNLSFLSVELLNITRTVSRWQGSFWCNQNTASECW